MTAEEIRNPGPRPARRFPLHKSHELELGSRPGRSFDRVFRRNGRSVGVARIVGYSLMLALTAPTQILCRTEPIFLLTSHQGRWQKAQWN